MLIASDQGVSIASLQIVRVLRPACSKLFNTRVKKHHTEDDSSPGHGLSPVMTQKIVEDDLSVFRVCLAAEP